MWVQRSVATHVTSAESQVLCPGQQCIFGKDQAGKKPESKKSSMGQACWPGLLPSPSQCMILENSIEWGALKVISATHVQRPTAAESPATSLTPPCPPSLFPTAQNPWLQPLHTTTLLFYTRCWSPFSAAHGKHWLLPCGRAGWSSAEQAMQSLPISHFSARKAKQVHPPRFNLALAVQYR